MEALHLTRDLLVLCGAVNTGVLRAGSRALLFDCCDRVTPSELARLGVTEVEMILFTQHRRPNTAGGYAFADTGAALVAPAGELDLFERPADYWNDPVNRWHIYHHQPTLVPAFPFPAARAVSEGDSVAWRGYTIRVLDTPGATDGSVSYVLDVDGTTVCFCGDVVYGMGQIWDLWSLQKGYGTTDYHGFIGNKRKLIPSLHKLGACGAGVLVPSHGSVIRAPAKATARLVARIEALWRNVAAISCLNHYFPALFEALRDDPMRMAPVPTRAPPDFVHRVACPSFALVSDTGAALLIDCGPSSVPDTLHNWIARGTIRCVDACWVTHYHDDHVDALARLVNEFGCPVMTDRHMAEILEHPTRFFLPCVSPTAVPVARRTREGESWTWHEFRLTAFHFPGQTFYHGGLLVEGHGTSVFFAGDSGAPTGLDDHCCGNRNFLGPGRGFRQCLAVWRRCRPEYILNQHQDRAFAFDETELAYMERLLAEREQLLGSLLPWAHPDFGTDEGWVRTYPYEQTVQPDSSFVVALQFTNHGSAAAEGVVEPVLPDQWTWDEERSQAAVRVPGRTDGVADAWTANPDRSVRIRMSVPDCVPTGRYVIPFRVTWDGRYLGQFRHAVVAVTAP